MDFTKQRKIIRVDTTGSIDIVQIELSTVDEITKLFYSVPNSKFDCGLCGKKCDGKATIGSFFNNGVIGFSLYYSDGFHTDNCDVPFNKLSSIFTHSDCGCGFSNHHDTKGNFYFVKHDMKLCRKTKSPVDHSKPITRQIVDDNDTTSDVTIDDFEYFKKCVEKKIKNQSVKITTKTSTDGETNDGETTDNTMTTSKTLRSCNIL